MLFVISCLGQPGIKNYKQFYGMLRDQNKDLLVLRKFEQEGRTQYLVTDPQELDTRILSAAAEAVKPLTWAQAMDTFKETPYVKAIEAAQMKEIPLQDAGIIHGFPKEKGITLTIDLCPSHKPLDRIIFTSLIKEFQKTEKPVPLALSITGRWMLTHNDDLDWLKNLVKSGDISITWVNHSYNHRVSPTAPLKVNFLLEPGTDMNFEVMGTELAMLQHGIMPSVFFRFPGLVSDPKLISKVLSYGLIPVGSDAWLAKGQTASSGSIVLIHGNGNEPIGVNDFIKLLQTEQKSVKDKQWMMYDLRESVEDEFGGK
ncbi:polysaccharide deacetylase [Pedobacter sp. HMWF019]|uniref:polysaccharide deacetylase family protein n=1 Tax=Pedobacter sp. HMWF019 TaxID=2056856 RepID=UPI000D38109D|nr:polysaccharide deacetylase [Pedobacter sp. HMWF019]PTS98084.1 polysaccharide deacetylase [Pedobacter sp. HMWF019]